MPIIVFVLAVLSDHENQFLNFLITKSPWKSNQGRGTLWAVQNSLVAQTFRNPPRRRLYKTETVYIIL